jgi:prevent-host-death family protein
MTDNAPQHISVRDFRASIKEILDGTRFLNRCYIVTNRARAVAQVLPPNDDMHDLDRVTVTDVRKKSGKLLDAVQQEEKPFIVLRYGRPAALIHPVTEQNRSTKEVPPADSGRQGHSAGMCAPALK